MSWLFLSKQTCAVIVNVVSFRKDASMNMELAQLIFKTRKKKGLTQVVLAEKTNLSISTIKRIERGKVVPRAHTLNILAEVLELEVPRNIEHFESDKDSITTVLTSLILLFAPPLNIIFLLILKSQNKKRSFFQSMGNHLLYFQMCSLILFILLLFAALSLTYIATGHKIYGQINSPFILYIFFIIVNLFAAYARLKRGIQRDAPLMIPS